MESGQRKDEGKIKKEESAFAIFRYGVPKGIERARKRGLLRAVLRITCDVQHEDRFCSN
jgi:hypothetical protein